MFQIKTGSRQIHGFILSGLFVLLAAGSIPGLSQERSKPEIIQATARGTSTQAGKQFQVKLIINDYSTEGDRQILIEAFNKGKNQGLVNALEKMNAVGRIAIEGTLGYDLSFVRAIPTPTGPKIRFVTNRLLRFGETYYSTRTADYNLTGGEIDLNNQDKSKSTGILYPAAKLKARQEQRTLAGSQPEPLAIVKHQLGPLGICSHSTKRNRYRQRSFHAP